MVVYLIADVKALQAVIANLDASNTILVKNCIKESVKVFRAIDLLEETCSFMILIQHTLDTLMLCTIVFIIRGVSYYKKITINPHVIYF